MTEVECGIKAFDVHELYCHFLAERLGFYADEALAVRVVDVTFTPDERLPQRNYFQVACGAAYLGRREGFPFKVVLAAEFVRTCLVPREGAIETIEELRGSGIKVGLITVCTEDVELLWPESEFAGLFDAEIFSNAIGLSKPDPRIYLACCQALGVEPRDAVFVGDGANDELAGARRVGMEAVLIHRPGEEPPWPELRDWDGPRIDALPQILDLVRGG